MATSSAIAVAMNVADTSGSTPQSLSQEYLSPNDGRPLGAGEELDRR